MRRAVLVGVAAALVTIGAAFAIRSLRPSVDARPPKPSTESTPETKPDLPKKETTDRPEKETVRITKGVLRVYAHAGGVAVADASVVVARGALRPIFGKTGPDGSWSVELETGEWEVGVRHPAYMPAHADVAVPADLALELKPGARASGRVVDARGAAIPDVRVTVVHPETLLPLMLGLEAKTDADGRYEIDGIPPQAVTLAFVSARHRPGRADLFFSRAGEAREANAKLEDANVLAGRVLDESGNPIVGAHVMAGNELVSTAETDADGRFTIHRLGDGPVQVSAGARGFGTVYVRDVAPNRTDLVIRLPKVGAISGRIVADPLPEWVEIKVWRFDEHFQKDLMVKGFRMACRGAAQFRIEDLSPGSYTLTAEAPGYEIEAPVPAAVERGGVTGELPLRLRRK